MEIAIIGAGAGGIVAAITAARKGGDVTIYEKSDRIGRKILASGNGRCNLSNTNMSGKFYNAPEYVDGIYKLVPLSKVLEFFKSIGLLTYCDEEGRIYPVTNQASTVLDCLRNELARLNVKIITNAHIKLDADSSLFNEYDKVIWATGGNAGGSAIPSLVPLVTDKKWLKAMNGVRVDARLTFNGATEQGEVLFRDYGISGIAVFNISAMMARQAAETGKYGGVIKMELLPGMDKAELIKNLTDKLKNITDKPDHFFTGMLNKNLSAIISNELGLSRRRITAQDIESIAELMKNIHINVYKPKGFAEAQVVSGGISLDEVDNVRSKLNDKLLIIGEALNVDGLCGGYNLHFAWATGILAGKL